MHDTSSPPELRWADPTAAFVRANTRLQPLAFIPEMSLYLADEAVPLWQKTEEELGAMGLPPPFWAFAWAGGQALARYILDNPEKFFRARVLDLASGSGLVAIAAALAGANPVIANDIDGFAHAAMALNAETNGAYIDIVGHDMLETPAPAISRYDIVLVGDLFYEKDTACRALAFVERHQASGAEILIGDPGRTYLPQERLERVIEYRIPVTRELEDNEIKRTSVWRLKP
ncbi:ribosomal protein L11 methyltransferase [Variibacter gotjawalensis]|uniref:Ribosomal protein L11 methyltransferase n=1 Tax=Variibacter gotjawalensis TaxID=1333996 RepID=A0A0S3PP22_9BRAD|nr:50S ribosomal protein L11 methyltransferase [Variibacter gotjawalensis]NIK47909.1 putative nicotinamide N-methyase [Variibacter gotjawalensis]RZS49787.1 putative nicotinamide N-methyase [Variibacter gotjawalensis]BAT57616.1 ribosomal protein L11 methyltransferase [Variibacter gotjawalensis]